jgi:hypothetical protein
MARSPGGNEVTRSTMSGAINPLPSRPTLRSHTGAIPIARHGRVDSALNLSDR